LEMPTTTAVVVATSDCVFFTLFFRKSNWCPREELWITSGRAWQLGKLEKGSGGAVGGAMARWSLRRWHDAAFMRGRDGQSGCSNNRSSTAFRRAWSSGGGDRHDFWFYFAWTWLKIYFSVKLYLYWMLDIFSGIGEEYFSNC
jgi:hypothetical protein